MVSDEKFLLCAPRFYGVEYVINPWMRGNVGRVRREVAVRQWNDLHQALAARAAIEVVDPVPGLPDMPFAANAGLVHRDLFVPARFRFPQRQDEVRHFAEWFRGRGYRIVELAGQGTFEGEGDAIFQPGEAYGLPHRGFADRRDGGADAARAAAREASDRRDGR